VPHPTYTQASYKNWLIPIVVVMGTLVLTDLALTLSRRFVVSAPDQQPPSSAGGAGGYGQLGTAAADKYALGREKQVADPGSGPGFGPLSGHDGRGSAGHHRSPMDVEKAAAGGGA
jgi:hypothetical protein